MEEAGSGDSRSQYGEVMLDIYSLPEVADRVAKGYTIRLPKCFSLCQSRFGKEAIRCKRLTKQRAAVRDLLSNAIADYNKVTTNKVVTAPATILWANRVLGDFMKKAPPKSPVKQKDRTLDPELRAHAKASTPGWDWQKLSFVLEKKGEVQDEEISKAQKRINSALHSTLQAGYALFETNLQNDQLQHRRYLQTSSGDEARARAAVIQSLEDCVNDKYCPDDQTDTSGVMEARLQPWLAECLAGFNGGVRRPDNECIIGIFNLTTQGVLSADKLHFALQQLTTLSHAYPKTFVGLVVMPNRAGDLKQNGCKP
eukprot:s1736_g1.t1